MQNEFTQIFSHLASKDPPARLFGMIMSRIRKEERVAAVKRLIGSSLAILLSASGFMFAVTAFTTAFTQSGFTQFLSLIASDLTTVLANWKEFSLALLESLPAMSMTASLAALLIFLWSLKILTQTTKVILYQQHH